MVVGHESCVGDTTRRSLQNRGNPKIFYVDLKGHGSFCSEAVSVTVAMISSHRL